MTKKIIWIDDDINVLETQAEWLRKRGFELETFSNVDEAWERIRESENEVLYVIIDVMMATGAIFDSADTNGGLNTGARFLEYMDEKKILTRCHVMIFTIRDDDRARRVAERLSIPYYRKQHYKGSAIVRCVVGVFGEP
jgi:CheY-like chemotaxis protein